MARQDKPPNPSSRIPVEEINEILEQHDSLILLLAQKHIPRSILGADWEMEIDELAQNIRCKLWQALQKREIHNVKSYIRAIARNEGITMLRQQPPTVSLLTNDEGELYQTGIIVGGSQEPEDPTERVEAEEMMEQYSERIVPLPLQQRRAIICTLKDQIADLLPLVDIFMSRGVNIRNLEWPEEESELQSLRVSLSVAHKKLRAFTR
jgi:RNA polymerase sigma factor (sigma-70 family)